LNSTPRTALLFGKWPLLARWVPSSKQARASRRYGSKRYGRNGPADDRVLMVLHNLAAILDNFSQVCPLLTALVLFCRDGFRVS